MRPQPEGPNYGEQIPELRGNHHPNYGETITRITGKPPLWGFPRNSRCALGVGSEPFEGPVSWGLHTEIGKFAHNVAHRFVGLVRS